MKLPFSKLSPRILGSDAFGPAMTQTQVKSAFVRAKDSDLWRVMGQMALAMREECVENTTRSIAAEKPILAAQHNGGGDVCGSLAGLLADLAEGKLPDEVKAWFPE